MFPDAFPAIPGLVHGEGLRVGNPDESLELGGQPAAVFSPLVWGYDPNDPDIHMVPEDYLMALVAAAAARLSQPVDREDLEQIRSTLWDLLIKVTQGPMSSTYSPLQYTYHRRDMQTWHNRKSPPPLLQPELLKWRHWRPGQVNLLPNGLWNSICAADGRNASPLTLRPMLSTSPT